MAVARRASVGLYDRLIELCGAAGFSPDIAMEVDDPDLLPVAREGVTAQTREFLLLVENLRHRSRLQPSPAADLSEDRPDDRVALEAAPRLLQAV